MQRWLVVLKHVLLNMMMLVEGWLGGGGGAVIRILWNDLVVFTERIPFNVIHN